MSHDSPTSLWALAAIAFQPGHGGEIVRTCLVIVLIATAPGCHLLFSHASDGSPPEARVPYFRTQDAPARDRGASIDQRRPDVSAIDLPGPFPFEAGPPSTISFAGCGGTQAMADSDTVTVTAPPGGAKDVLLVNVAGYGAPGDVASISCPGCGTAYSLALGLWPYSAQRATVWAVSSPPSIPAPITVSLAQKASFLAARACRWSGVSLTGSIPYVGMGIDNKTSITYTFSGTAPGEVIVDFVVWSGPPSPGPTPDPHQTLDHGKLVNVAGPNIWMGGSHFAAPSAPGPSSGKWTSSSGSSVWALAAVVLKPGP